MSVQVKVSANGRICIPADVRERLGLKDGSTLTLEETADGLVLTTFAQRVKSLQKRYAEMTEGQPPFTSEDLIRERRAEAAREEEKYRQLHGD